MKKSKLKKLKEIDAEKVMALHYIDGIDFPWFHQEPRHIIKAPKLPKELHIISIWKER